MKKLGKRLLGVLLVFVFFSLYAGAAYAQGSADGGIRAEALPENGADLFLVTEDEPAEDSWLYPDYEEAYGDFICGRKYDALGQDYYENVRLTLYDTDLNGIPEILIWNGIDSWSDEDIIEDVDGKIHVYTFRDGRVEYAGDMYEKGTYPDDIVQVSDLKPGLIYWLYDEQAGQETWYREYMSGGNVEKEELSSDIWDDDLYYLRWYMPDKIDEIGWPLFLEAPFRLSAVGLDFSADDTYTAGKPVNVTLEIRSGRAPYNVTLYWYELDENGYFFRDLSTDTFTTEDLSITRQFTPESSDRDICLEIYVQDVFGTSSGYADPYMKEIRRAGGD